MSSTSRWIQPHIGGLHPYVPGEQPKSKRLIKLNTNENPYSPSPKVIKATKRAVGDQLRLYPHPTADPLREKLAALHGCDREQLIIGNGSDELLALATRAFVAPQGAVKGGQKNRSTIQYFTPSYSLYPVLTAIQNAIPNEVPLPPSYALPSAKRRSESNWNPKAALTFVTTPNAPSGRPYSTHSLRQLCRELEGIVILDEAYVDFAEEDALELIHEFENVIVSRTFSKAYSLCFQRIGYFVGPEPLITALHKIRDSYNVNGLAQVAAEATLDDLEYYRANFKNVINTREQLAKALTDRHFKVLPSATNFLLVAPPKKRITAEQLYQELKNQGILVRWFADPRVRDYLRISIGTPEHIREFLAATDTFMQGPRP